MTASVDTAALRELLEKATKGPWVAFTDRGNTLTIMPAGRPGDVCNFAPPYPTRGDADLIVAIPTVLPALLAEVERLRAKLKRKGSGCGCHWTYKDEKDLEGTQDKECAYHMDQKRGLLDEVERRRADEAELVGALEEAGATFARYAEGHRAKGTVDGEQKAAANDFMSKKIRSLLAKVKDSA